jgi:four helix bundle protein
VAGVRYGMRQIDTQLPITRARLEDLSRGIEMGDFRKLEVWERAQELVRSVYRLTSGFPSVERYGLSSQMRRAAVSVSSNLAEDCGRMRDTELRRFVLISLGSLSELECELYIAASLEFKSPETCRDLSQRIGSVRGMLLQLHRALAKRRL